MSHCPYQISSYLLNTITEKECITLLNLCEQNCKRYYQCDTVACINDRLKDLQGDLIKCPYCDKYYEPCDCPDLFYSSSDNTANINTQYKLLQEIQELNYNIVTCGHCGEVFIHKIKD